MRAQEFLTERANLDIFKPGTSLEKTVDVAGIGPVTLKLSGKPASMNIPYVQIMAYAPDGDEVGYFRFHVFGLDDMPYVTAGNIRVHREYQRRGVATAVYQWMRELGNDIRPSTSRTDQGQAMWSGFEKKHSLAEEQHNFTTAYHITTEENANEIDAVGLRPRDGNVYLVVDEGDQQQLRRELYQVAGWLYARTEDSDEELNLLKIDIRGIPLTYRDGWYRAQANIPADRVENLGWEPLAGL